MEKDSVSVEELRALHERGFQELPRRVELFSRHTAIDAHAKASFPASLLTALETLSFLSADGKSVPIDKVNDYLDTFNNKAHQPHLRSLAHELTGWIRAELKIGNAKSSEEPNYSLSKREALRSIANYTDRLEQARGKENRLISHQDMDALLMPIAKRMISASKGTGIYHLNDEEREILSKEIIAFSLAKPHDKERSKSDDVPAYRTDVSGVSGENIMNAYQYMLRCAGSKSFEHVVGAVFKQLADGMSNKLSVIER